MGELTEKISWSKNQFFANSNKALKKTRRIKLNGFFSVLLFHDFLVVYFVFMFIPAESILEYVGNTGKKIQGIGY
jgi:hypothetical protein